MSYKVIFLCTPCQHALNMRPLSISPSDVTRHPPCNLAAGLHEEQAKLENMTHYRVTLCVVLFLSFVKPAQTCSVPLQNS
jgi:hypothetical protein